MKKLDLNALVVFHSVWTHRSVTRAAEELHVAQPTVSTCLRRLRRFFDDTLFTWEGSRMIPTAKAQALAPEIAAIVDRASNLIEQTKYDPFKVERDMTIASADYVFAMLGASLNRQLDREAPRLRLSFLDATAELFPRLRTLHSAELYIFPQDIAPSQGMRYARLLTDTYVVVQWNEAKRRRGRLGTQAFLECPKVMFSVDHRRLANHEMSRFVAQGMHIQVNMLVPNYLAIPSMLVGTNRLAVMPRNVLKLSQLGALTTVECDVAFPELELGIYWDPFFEKDLVHSWLRKAVMTAAAEWRP